MNGNEYPDGLTEQIIDALLREAAGGAAAAVTPRPASACDQCGDALDEHGLSETAGAAWLYQVLGGLAARAEVATGTCALSSCYGAGGA